MTEPPPPDRAAKVLADLLAIVLDSGQSAAAVEAIRRRAEHDGVTGGAVKNLALRLQQTAAPQKDAEAAERRLNDLRWALQDQQRELVELRRSQLQASSILAASQDSTLDLHRQVRALFGQRRSLAAIAFVAGFTCGAALLALRPWQPAAEHVLIDPQDRGAALLPSQRARLANFAQTCFLQNTNSMEGTAFPIHLLLDLRADGSIAAAALAPEQTQLMTNPDLKTYSDMVIRTLNSGSCGPPPLPPSLQGKAGRIDLHLPA